MKDYNKNDILRRLKTAHGHLGRVIKMVDNNAYCIDVLQQSIAVQSALKRADEQILSNHLATCVRDALSDTAKEKQLKEILEIFKKGRG